LNPAKRKFTWSNIREKNIFVKLDRILVTTDWEAAFPLVRVSALPKNTSDHKPFLIDFGNNCSRSKKKFSFEKWWLKWSDKN
jgi:endonuclease/exonuclease/phosphatase family metal-dependent hydrolase